MSNLIKSPYVNLQEKEPFVIDSNIIDKAEDMFQLNKGLPIVKKMYKDKENDSKESTQREDPDGFLAGVSFANTTEMIENEIKQAKEEAEKILENARESAEKLLEDAMKDSKKINKEAYDTGKIEGYSAGEVEAKETYRVLEEELKQKQVENEMEYLQKLEEIEPRYVEVVISLLKNLTGVLLEEHSDLILFLIKKSLTNLDKSKKYVIRMSKEDASLIETKKEEIKKIVGEMASVEFWEEKSLGQNECIIETDLQMVDCGFKTQLENMIMALRFLVS